MKRNNEKRNQSGFESDHESHQGKKRVGQKDKSSKRRLSIYDDYEEDDSDYVANEKFKNRHK